MSEDISYSYLVVSAYQGNVCKVNFQTSEQAYAYAEKEKGKVEVYKITRELLRDCV